MGNTCEEIRKAIGHIVDQEQSEERLKLILTYAISVMSSKESED